ncbi:cell division cycle-associated 7-like protein [Momordica charantia]|uniref:Cell division cycle-associated 7-like protein n=1 Tax=Momordica charantia TaxID=3673 RepID=A0A6J1C5M8_MOMCH|nr:cell division cycle-associated 7-like protein [Momordica charantia]
MCIWVTECHFIFSLPHHFPISLSYCCSKEETNAMGRLRAKCDYEDIRNARILENQERLASLGLKKTVSELRSILSSAKSPKIQPSKCRQAISRISLPLRRSDRLKRITPETTPLRCQISYRRSDRLKGKLMLDNPNSDFKEVGEIGVREETKKRPANAPLVDSVESKHRLSPDASARTCNSKGRGSVYDPVFGICCHFCRQKKLCGEEDCKRCGDFDMDEPCIGKTDCSVCHSSNGVFCRACLKVRYGEEIEEVIENKKWMCPHCVEEKGIDPYWICNSSLCLKKRKMAPTGPAIYRAREMGYQSVAHLLMDELKRADLCKR